jgi:large conductance mechanosensitive channel
MPLSGAFLEPESSMLDPKKKVFSLVDEFKNFALKGNVIDLAVGVIIGAAFGKIVTSLVENIIMPLIGAIMPVQEDYKELGFYLGNVFIPSGRFMGDIVNFFIVALALFFFIVKFLGFVMHLRKEDEVAPPPPTRDQELLMEIRDLLKKNEPR